MSNNTKGDAQLKPIRRTYRVKRRLKSSIVRDPNGSISTFRQFYQSGGRDYEQYRLWLQTLSTSTINAKKIKKETSDTHYSKTNISLPISPMQSSMSVPKLECNSSVSRPTRPLPVPISVLPPLSLPSTSPFTLERHPLREHSHISMIPIASSSSSSLSLPASPLNNWSVNDVAQFIEKYFPEKATVRKFIEQKIDGRTLPLLTEDHLTRIFKMKLGPALRLLDLISNIKK